MQTNKIWTKLKKRKKEIMNGLKSKRNKIERFLRNGSVTNEEKYKRRANEIEKNKIYSLKQILVWWDLGLQRPDNEKKKKDETKTKQYSENGRKMCSRFSLFEKVWIECGAGDKINDR